MSKEKKVSWKPLALDVIVVAVEGNNHDYEWQKVRDRGSKLPKEVGEVLFPDFKHLKWRY